MDTGHLQGCLAQLVDSGIFVQCVFLVVLICCSRHLMPTVCEV